MGEEDRSALHPTERQFSMIVVVLAAISKILEREKNTIRPSTALEAIADVISALTDFGVTAFYNHVPAWSEVKRLLMMMSERVAGTTEDSKRAMRFEPFEWPEADMYALMGRAVTELEGNYKAFAGNRNSNTFGALTPAECLKMIYRQMDALAPKSQWRYGPWKNPGAYQTWIIYPWAEWVMNEIRHMYEAMEGDPAYNIPPGYTPPFSAPPTPGGGL